MAHIVTVDEIDGAFLARADQQMLVRLAATGFIWQQHRPARTQVEIRAAQRGLIVRREIVRQSEPVRRGQFQKTVAIAIDCGRGVKRAVAGDEVKVAAGIAGRPAARLPDAAHFAIGRSVELIAQGQRLRAITNDPAVIRAVVAMRGGSQIDDALAQQQRRPVELRQWIERHLARAVVAGPGARHRCRDYHRPAKLLRPARQVQRVQAVIVVSDIVGDLLGLGRHVNRPAGGVNHRRARDADFRHEVFAVHVVAVHRRDARVRVDETHLPQRRGAAVRVERIHAVMLRGHIDHVMHALAGNRHARHHQRLGIHIAVHRQAEDFSEVRRGHAGRRQNRLIGVLAGARAVVVIRQDIHFRQHIRRRPEQAGQQNHPPPVLIL